jgi:lipopolysaccharide export system protein LptC
VTLARARRAVLAADGSQAQLLGGAEVDSTDAAGRPLALRSEFLHAFFVTERVTSHLPVLVRQGPHELQAGGVAYDHPAQRLDLQGPVRARFAARGAS